MRFAVIILFSFFATQASLAFEDLLRANGSVLNTCGDLHLAIEKETDFIILKKDLSVSGDRICHDGKHVYFKSVKVCDEHNELMAEHGIEAVACNDQPLAPLKAVEQIHLSPDNRMFRFFAVDIYYESRIRGVSETCTTEAIRSEHILDVCDPEVHPTQFPETIWRDRNATAEETEFLEKLVDNGFGVINSPAGTLTNLLFAEPVFFDFLRRGSFSSFSIGSPMCNSEFADYFQKAGGEFTGTSRTLMELMDPFVLEEYTSPLKGESLSTDNVIKTSGSSVSCNYQVDI